MFSYLTIVTLALSLSSFGVQTNPNAPTGTEVARFAPAQADARFYVDLQAVVPNNYDAFRALGANKTLMDNSEVARNYQQALTAVDGAIGMAKGASGVDIINDVKSIAGWATLANKGDPTFLIAVRGNFPGDLIAKLANVSGEKLIKIGGNSAINLEDQLLARAADGTVLFGAPKWVRSRIKSTWRPRPPRRGSANAQVISAIDRKPFAYIGMSLSKTAAKRLRKELHTDANNALFDLITGHKYAGVSLTNTGAEWTWTARTKAGLGRAKLASTGILSLMRAYHYSARGMSDIVFAALDSYRGKNRGFDEVLRHKKELMKLIMEMTGDGKFKESIRTDPRTNTLTVTATGRSLSDVLPIATLPMIGAGAWLFSMAPMGPGPTSHPTLQP